MKRILLLTGLMVLAGTIQANDKIFTEPVQVEALSSFEMQETKAGAIYWEHDGIKGNVTATKVTSGSVHFGVRRAVSMDAGKMANREVGKPVISEVTIR